MWLDLHINVKSYCKEVRIPWTPQLLKIRWGIPWLSFDEVDLGEQFYPRVFGEELCGKLCLNLHDSCAH